MNAHSYRSSHRYVKVLSVMCLESNVSSWLCQMETDEHTMFVLQRFSYVCRVNLKLDGSQNPYHATLMTPPYVSWRCGERCSSYKILYVSINRHVMHSRQWLPLTKVERRSLGTNLTLYCQSQCYLELVVYLDASCVVFLWSICLIQL